MSQPVPPPAADPARTQVPSDPARTALPPGPGQPPQPLWQRPHPLTPLVQGWIGLVALGFFLFRDVIERGGNLTDINPAQLAASAALYGLIGLVTVVVGYLSWRFTRFVVADDALRIEHNFIQHRSDQILYTKVQSVDIVSPFAARLIGLAGLRIDVGGGEAKKLQYLTRSAAETMRDELVRRALGARLVHPDARPDGLRGALGGQPARGAGHSPRPDAPLGGLQTGEPQRVVVTVSPQQLVLATITSAEFVSSVLGLIVFGAVPWAVTGRFWTAGLVVPAAFGLVGLLTNRVVNEWNYRLSLGRSGAVRVSRGLTSTVSQTVPVQRIQGFAISQSLLGRLVGLWRVQIEVLGYAGDEADQGGSTVLLPAGTWVQVMTALQTVWPGFDPDQVPLQPLPRRGRWLRPVTWHTHRWGRDAQVILHRGGVLVHTINIVHHARVQSVSLHQGPLQRRHHLATARVHITNGPVDVTIASMDASDAAALVRTELEWTKLALATARPTSPYPVRQPALWS